MARVGASNDRCHPALGHEACGAGKDTAAPPVTKPCGRREGEKLVAAAIVGNDLQAWESKSKRSALEGFRA